MWNSGFFALVFPTETFNSPAAHDSQRCVENQFKTQHNWIWHHIEPDVEIHTSVSVTGQMMNGWWCLGRFCSPEHIVLILNVREQVIILLAIMGMPGSYTSSFHHSKDRFNIRKSRREGKCKIWRWVAMKNYKHKVPGLLAMFPSSLNRKFKGARQPCL